MITYNIKAAYVNWIDWILFAERQILNIDNKQKTLEYYLPELNSSEVVALFSHNENITIDEYSMATLSVPLNTEETRKEIDQMLLCKNNAIIRLRKACLDSENEKSIISYLGRHGHDSIKQLLGV